MQISKKQLIGMGGLAAVAGLTAYAFTIPAPGASAASVSGAVQISVEVYNSEIAEIDITSPTSDTVTLDSSMNIDLFYSSAAMISYTLTNTTTGGSVSGSYVPDTVPESGTRSLTFDLSADDLGFGRYRFDADINNGTDYAFTTFSYIPLAIDTVGKADNGDPIIELNHAKGVTRVSIQAYGKNGKPLFATPVSIAIDDPNSPGKQTVTLPFAANGAATGDYTIVATPKDTSGNDLPTVSGQIESDADYVAPDSPVTPDTDDDDDKSDSGSGDTVAPDVPKTGGFLADLNISRADYLITGLIVFGLATVLAFVALKKQKKSGRR